MHFNQKLNELRSKQQQLAAIDALGSEEQREELHGLVDEVCYVLRPVVAKLSARVMWVGSRVQLNWPDARGVPRKRWVITASNMWQVRAAEVQAGEEAALRLRLRQMEARRASVQRCGMVHTAVMGDSGAGGLHEGLRSVQTQLSAVLADEEAYAALRAGEASLARSP
jgi:hypothetical protein